MTQSKQEFVQPNSTVDPENWSEFKEWLDSDTPAQFDLLSNYSVAVRIKRVLDNGCGSIGIVGPYGSGKTSIVNWCEGLLERESNQVILSKHSCWGFATSAASIHSMLDDALSRISTRVDTFHIRSLPDSYRQTFSAAGKWVSHISRILIGQRSPLKQFGRLSRLLDDLNLKLVIVVEDLDRNDSKSFDSQDILACLQQLRQFPNLSFILTGGLVPAARIDFSKLCDHIEHLRPLTSGQSGEFVKALRDRCLDRGVFKYDSIVDPAENIWESERWMLISEYDDVHPPEAVARLLNTPRAMRHALGATYDTWSQLFGEIDFDHLLALNVIRFAAPEAFSFVLEHWRRFRKYPSDYIRSNRQLDLVSEAIQKEWQQIVKNCEWDAKAARTLIDFILPATPVWIDGKSHTETSRRQGLHRERCWQLAIIGDRIEGDVLDQEVIRDAQQWRGDQNPQLPLVRRICESQTYAGRWEYWYQKCPVGDSDDLLELSNQVLTRILTLEGVEASANSQGFHTVCRVAKSTVPQMESNAQWLLDRIEQAAKVSLRMVIDFLYYWVAARDAIVRDEDRQGVLSRTIKILQDNLTHRSLSRIVPANKPYIFRDLVYKQSWMGQMSVEPERWAWLGKVLVDAINDGQPIAALSACGLASETIHKGHQVDCVATMARFRQFFGDDEQSLLERIEKLIPQVDDEYHRFMREFIESARKQIRDEDKAE